MFMTVLAFVLAATVIFVTIQLMSPFLYDLWYENLRDMVAPGNLQDAGDRIFASWQIMSFVVPGILMMWGFMIANRKRVQEAQYE